MKNPRNSCYQCKDRHIGCHSNCERYREYRRKWDEAKAKRDEERKAAQETIERFTKAKDIKNKVRKGRY